MTNATNTTTVSTANSVMGSIVNEATTVAKGKVENYSADVTVSLLAAYAGGSTVEQLAEKFAKTTRSIVAKLSREKVYVKKAYVTKAGSAPVSKEQYVANIAAFLNIGSDKLESLEKANKGVLQILENALKPSADEFDSVSETVVDSE